jgi:hypothetical protein
MKTIKFPIDFVIVNIELSIEELIYPHLPDDAAKQYFKLRRLLTLYRQAQQAGWEEFSWERVKTEGKGWLCKNDFQIFDELKDSPL